MAEFKRAKDMKQVKLVGFWQPDRDCVYNDYGRLQGIYVDWQVDQTDLTVAEIKAGKYDKNPHLVTKETDEGVSHKAYFSVEQIKSVLSLYRDSRDFKLDQDYRRDDVKGLGVIADVQSSGSDQVMMPVLFTSDEASKNNIVSRLGQKFVHPCRVSPTCMDDGRVRPGDIDRQLSGVYEIAKFFDTKADRVDRLRDVNYDKVYFERGTVGIAYPDIPDGTMDSDSQHMFLNTDAYEVRSAVDHMLERDGRFQSIDYSLFSNSAALAAECKKHDGIVRIDLDDGYLSVPNRDRKREPLFDQMSRSNFADEMEADRARGIEYAWYDSMERQVALENEASKNGYEYHVPRVDSNFDLTQSDDVRLSPRSAAKVLSSEKFVKDVPLIASWSEDDLTRGRVGSNTWASRVTGAYVDVQIDQSKLSATDIENGKGYSNPSVNCSSHKDPNVAMTKLWYSTKQLEQMQSAGSNTEHKGYPSGGILFTDRHYCSFTANLMVREGKSGQKTTVVLLPKEIIPEMDGNTKATVEVYNRLNSIKPSQHGDSFSLKDVDRQLAVTRQVCNLTDFPSQHMTVENEQGKSLDLQVVNDMELG